MEITLKDDLRGDPLINEESCSSVKIINFRGNKHCKSINEKATKLIEEELASKGLELIDIKLNLEELTVRLL